VAKVANRFAVLLANLSICADALSVFAESSKASAIVEDIAIMKNVFYLYDMTDLLLALLLTKGDRREPGEESVSQILADKNVNLAMLKTFFISLALTCLLYLPVHFTESHVMINLLLLIPFGFALLACIGSLVAFLYGLILRPFY